MFNGDYIREMDNDRLARFLWTFEINTINSFFHFGGEKLKDAAELRSWLDKGTEEFVCDETVVNPYFVFDQDFRLKEGE